jgi:hypothetical protein
VKQQPAHTSGSIEKAISNKGLNLRFGSSGYPSQRRALTFKDAQQHGFSGTTTDDMENWD